jgi:hypothetical protein
MFPSKFNIIKKEPPRKALHGNSQVCISRKRQFEKNVRISFFLLDQYEYEG